MMLPTARRIIKYSFCGGLFNIAVSVFIHWMLVFMVSNIFFILKEEVALLRKTNYSSISKKEGMGDCDI